MSVSTRHRWRLWATTPAPSNWAWGPAFGKAGARKRPRQVVLSPTLFQLGVLPAVDVGRSVSRVGGKAQLAAFRAVAGDLKLAYAQFEELETFARFGAHLDDETQASITHGQRIRACLKQPELAPVTVPAQLAIVLALTAGLFDPVPEGRMADAEQAVVDVAGRDIPAALGQRLLESDKLTDEDRAAMVDLARGAIAAFLPRPNEDADGARVPAAPPSSPPHG